jgi:hypothetical protein
MKLARLEAVLIGNAAAALQGAPVTTMDLDFFYRDTPTNRKKLELVATRVGARLTQPYPQLSSLYRLDFGLVDFHVDFLAVAAGIRSLASLRSRATPVAIEGEELLVASLQDVMESKPPAGRPKSKPKMKRAEALKLLAEASEVMELEMIRSRLALPMHRRTNFLRVRVPGAPNGGTAI